MIKSSIRAGHIDNLGIITYNYLEGTPQGSILSPLLCNIFLDQFDRFLEELKNKYEIRTAPKKSKEHNKLSNLIRKLRKEGISSSDPAFSSALRDLLRTHSVSENNIKLSYIRYADDFIVGIQGSKNLCERIYEEIDQFFLDLGLKLNKDKTLITDLHEKEVNFLGFHFRNLSRYKKKFTYRTDPDSGRMIKMRSRTRLAIGMDYNKVLRRLVEKGFVRYGIRPGSHGERIPVGTFKGNLVNLDHPDILSYYSSIMRGLYNYYNVVNNMARLMNIL